MASAFLSTGSTGQQCRTGLNHLGLQGSSDGSLRELYLEIQWTDSSQFLFVGIVFHIATIYGLRRF